MVQLRSQSPINISTSSNPFEAMATTITMNSDGLIIKGNINQLKIKKVIFQKEHTIVLWEDGEKTIVRAFDEDFDKEKGLAIAIAKRFVNRSEFKRLIENADIQDK